MKANISELKIGFETSDTVQWDINTAETSYANVSVNGWFLFAIFYFVQTGQEAPVPQYAY